MSTRNQNPHIAQGQVGVHRVVAELIERGHAPYLPVIDDGIDILLGSGLRLQVKTTKAPVKHWRQEGRWSFTLTRAQRIVKRRYVPCSPRQFSAQVDFVILHALKANRYWIVPAAVLDGRFSINFKDGSKQWQACDVETARRLRASGLSYQAIADQLEIPQWVVRRRLDGSHPVPKRNYADIPQYESRWDLLTAAIVGAQETTRVLKAAASASPAQQETTASS